MPRLHLFARPLVFGLFLCGLAGAPARADFVGITWFTDTKTDGVAAVNGELNPNTDNRWAGTIDFGGLLISSVSPNGNWRLNVFFFTRGPTLLDIQYVEGQHVSNPPPHGDETAMGPLMNIGTIGAIGNAAYADLRGVGGAQVAPLVKQTSAPHLVTQHPDRMTAQVFDNDPNSNSVLSGASNNNLGMTVTFSHVPEPSPLILGSLMVLGLALGGRRR